MHRCRRTGTAGSGSSQSALSSRRATLSSREGFSKAEHDTWRVKGRLRQGPPLSLQQRRAERAAILPMKLN